MFKDQSYNFAEQFKELKDQSNVHWSRAELAEKRQLAEFARAEAIYRKQLVEFTERAELAEERHLTTINNAELAEQRQQAELAEQRQERTEFIKRFDDHKHEIQQLLNEYRKDYIQDTLDVNTFAVRVLKSNETLERQRRDPNQKSSSSSCCCMAFLPCFRKNTSNSSSNGSGSVGSAELHSSSAITIHF